MHAHLPATAQLQTRVAEHAGASGAGEAALASALEAIGWRAAGEDAVAAVASEAWLVLHASGGAGDPPRAARAIAEAMHRFAPAHSDFLASVDDFLPAAADVLRRYAAGETYRRVVPPLG